MNYIETIVLYYEQGAFESAAMVCENAFKATGNSLYLHASRRFKTACKYGSDMHSSALLAAKDALYCAKLANGEELYNKDGV